MNPFEALMRRFAGEQARTAERLPKIVIWCKKDLVHGQQPKPILEKGQELIETICTPCYNFKSAQDRALRES